MADTPASNSTETKQPESQFTITVTNVGADAKPSIIILETVKQKQEENKQVDKKQQAETASTQDDGYIEFDDSGMTGDEIDFLGAENEPFDENMSYMEDPVESVSSIEEGKHTERTFLSVLFFK